MVRTNNTAGLDGLVAGPYRWNAATYCLFFRDAYDNIIKAEVERLQNIEVKSRKQVEWANQNGSYKSNLDLTNETQNYDVKIAKLVQRLISESDQVLGNDNWTDIIGPELWDILKLDEMGKDRYKIDNEKDESVLKKKSVVQLLKFIRNKISHIRILKDDMKARLTQFFEKEDEDNFQFNENKFVAVWISKFPKLVPFLWIKLYKFRNKLVNYYPDYEIEIGKLQNFLMDIKKLETEIKSALFADMENGNVLRRFKGSSCSLEFRGFQNLVPTLDKNAFISFSINSKRNFKLSVSHSSTIRLKLEYEGTALGTEKLIIIFTDNVADKKIWKYCSDCDCRVILFCDPEKLTNEKIEEAVDKFKYENDLSEEFSELPIRASELSIEKQDWVYENGLVLVQAKDIKIKDIFTDKSEVLGVLSGDLLNKLLTQEKPVICAKYKCQEYKGVYINRRLYLTGKNGKGKTKNWEKELALENKIYEKEMSKKLRTKEMTPMHCCKKCTSSKVKITGINGVFEEIEFLDKINKEKVKSIYIIAKTGMGKSKLLLSLGKIMKSSLVIFCSFRIFMDLLKKVGTTEMLTKSDLKSVILEILKCRDTVERKLILKKA